MSLHARALALARGERQLFFGLTFEVNAGHALRVAGANGSGKTSLLRVLCGLSRADEGQVAWKGRDITEDRAGFAACMTYVGHADAIKHDLLAWENLAFGALAGQPGARAAALALLESEGLGEQAMLPARALSQGQRRRLALARLQLCASDSLWILDEPFSHLDAAACARLAAQLERHCAGGGMLVYTSHGDEIVAGAALLDLNAHSNAGAERAC